MMLASKLLTPSFVIFIALIANAALGQTQINEEHVRVSLMGVRTSLRTDVRIEIENQLLGTRIGFERILGHKSHAWIPAVIMSVRLHGKHSIIGQYYGLRRSAVGRPGIDLQLREIHIARDTEVRSVFSTRVFTLGYAYALVYAPRAELNVFVSAYLARLEVRVDAEELFVNEKENHTVPLPNVGMAGNHALSSRLRFNWMFSMFFLRFLDFEGSLHQVGLELKHQALRQLDFGVGYFIFDVDFERGDQRFNTVIDCLFHGPAVGVTVRF